MEYSSQRTNVEHLLREITNHSPKKLCQKSTLRINDIVAVTPSQVDFGTCVPTSMNEKKFSVVLKTNFAFARVISLQLVRKETSDLLNGAFGLRRDSLTTFFDQFKFRAVEQGNYTFQLGAQAPSVFDKTADAVLILTVAGVEGEIHVNITLSSRLPKISCNKELFFEDQRMLKVLFNRKKRQIKIPFKIDFNFTFTLLTDLIGPSEDTRMEIKPKSMFINQKSAFLISICLNQIPLTVQYWRKIIVFNIKNSNVHYSFPIQICFQPESDQNFNE